MVVAVFVYAIQANEDAGMGKGLNLFITGSLVLFIAGVLFKILHWAGADALMKINYVLAFSFPAALILQKNDFRISRQYCITFFTFFILLLGVLPNNPLCRVFGNGRDYTSSERMRQLQKNPADTVTKNPSY
jgi:hypothetical protein